MLSERGDHHHHKTDCDQCPCSDRPKQMNRTSGGNQINYSIVLLLLLLLRG